MDEVLLAEGEQAAAKLAPRTLEIQELIAANFAPKTLSQVQAEFEGQVTTGAVNEHVAKLAALVRDQAVMTIEDFKALEMWIHIKVPEASDGNNFGVDVQVFVLGEMKKIRDEIAAMLDGVSDYHKKRAEGLEKIVRPTSVTTDSEKKKETEGDKVVLKESTTEKSSSKVEAPLADYIKHLAALDAKEYHACYARLTDLRNAYVKAHLMMSKNKKRLSDPRGDGEGARSNAMTMF